MGEIAEAIRGRIEEGMEYDLKVDAKGASGEGIGRIGNFVVFIKNSKTRIGNTYKVTVTKKYRTFCNAELAGDCAAKLIGEAAVHL